MATLVLTSVGTALAGPLGGALGGLVGQSIDQGLFGGGMRRGPRLGDLAVQTSSYGSAIPRIYGRMRVAGTVVWATDLKEEEAIEGGGKSSPEQLGYLYSASLAVALSSRAIRSVGRIWADGKLIRGAGGQFTVPTRFRIATGSEDQSVDPLIASIETIARTPAYRGLALAIFEDLSLSEFGNRIPAFSFEIEADEGPPTIANIVADSSGGLFDLGESRTVGGYAAHGSTIADSIRPLIEHFGLPVAERDGKLRGPTPESVIQIDADELGCDSEAKVQPRIERLRRPDSSLPANIAAIYYDPERDFQAGQMRASSGDGGAVDRRTELPAVLAADEAKRWVEEEMARQWQAASSVRLRLPPSRIGLKPGDPVRLPDVSRSMMVKTVEIDGMAVAVEAHPVVADVASVPADPGRAVHDPDVPIGRTALALLEFPALGDAPDFAPKLYAAASNQGKWKPVPIEIVHGSAPIAARVLRCRAVLGTTTSALDARSPMILDELSSITVRLVNSGQILINADADALMAGANLAAIGDELVQFGRAEQLEPGLFRLSRLLRGRRGTDWACSTHAVGERFCLFDPAALVTIDLPASSAGATFTAIAHGIADSAPLPMAERPIGGEAMRPPTVCHLKAWREGMSLCLTWVRRTHRGFVWNDGVAVPSDSFPERYRVTIFGPAGQLQAETEIESAIIDVATLPAAAGQEIEVQVQQVGPMALGRPKATNIIL